MKNIINTTLLFLVCIFFSLLFIDKINAASLTGYTSFTETTYRDGPSTSNKLIGFLVKGNLYNMVSDEKVKDIGGGCPEGWYKIIVNGVERFSCSTYFTISSTSGNSNDLYNESDYIARVNSTFLNARTSPNSDSSVQDVLIQGTNLTIIGNKISGYGCSEGWNKVSYYNSREAFVCSSYIDIKSNLILEDKEYAAYLRTLGFPDSYIPYLSKLHKNHPNWVFQPLNTGLKFGYAVEQETAKKYIQTTNDIYRINNIEMETGGWYAANSKTIAYFLDPRNFLTENYMFIFEELSFDSKYPNANIVKSIFNGTYLASDNYVNTYVEAGRLNGVSPAHLASRTKQEGGTNPNYGSVSGNSNSKYMGYSLKGFYNFYNISANGDNPVAKGLWYACGDACGAGGSYGRPWNTREKAIIGGAQYIADDYIKVGQDTLYFQGLNTSPKSQYKFTNQYMTNIQATSSEAYSSMESYVNNGLINEAYKFSIPVYDDMPKYVSLPSFGDKNNNLSGIKVNNSYIQGFDPDITSYTVYTSSTLNEVSVYADRSSGEASVLGEGVIKLEKPETIVSLIVKAQNGETKTYNVTIVKVNEKTSIDEIIAGMNVKTNNGFMKDIHIGMLSTSLINSIKKISPSANVIFKDQNNNVINNQVDLYTGMSITITSALNESRSYKIVVNGDISGDGKITILDLLKIQKHIIKSTILTQEYLEAADTNYDNSVTILDLLRIQKHILGDLKL
ncbi:MAG: dockerin type I domain-containing protein [Bacilli bacterium]